MLQGLNEELALPLLQRRQSLPSRRHAGVFAKRVAITGAGGSIGSELARQVAGSEPEALLLVDQCELNLYEVNCTLAEADLDFEVLPVLTSVRDRKAISRLFDDFEPELVLHAAALKHVPLLENDHNLVEAVLTNVGGTKNVADATRCRDAEFVLVSTDKAVNPSSVMGLTKRVAEQYVLGLCDETHRMCQVRFGNVLGSSGSVVPLFRRQIAQGGPVTVTHPEMTRYLMSIREAVSLVLSAADLHMPRRGAGLYVLDMGEPVRIVDLAERLIRLSGLRPGVDVMVEFTGVRPGEKLREELAYENEVFEATAVERVSFCQDPGHPAWVLGEVDRLLYCATKGEVAEVKDNLLVIVPEYSGREVWK